MEVRQYKPSDYISVASWWVMHDWPVIDADHLPKHGFIVDDKAVGFLYMTDSKIAWLEFIVANPNVSKEDRSEALDLVINKLIDLAKELEFKTVFSSVTHPRLIERYKRHGFVVTDTGMTNMIRRV
jgi:hypothetical protein